MNHELKNIYQTLPKLHFSLAPMEGVTDTVFRQIINQAGRPDLLYTEFTNVEGIMRGNSKFVRQSLQFQDHERPLIAQIWGLEPDNYRIVAQQIVELGFDGIDINMGCPVRKIVAKGACSRLIENPQLAVDIIHATKQGADGKIPVSVKTRIGYSKVVTEQWATTLLQQDIDALTIHGRTSKQMSKVPADWDEIAKVVQIRDQMGIPTKIIGNGDILSLAQGKEAAERTGVDGIMIGRGIFHNPWLFNPDIEYEKITIQDRIQLLTSHINLHIHTWGNDKQYAPLKRFFKIYIRDFDGAPELRTQLMDTTNTDQALNIIQRYTSSM